METIPPAPVVPILELPPSPPPPNPPRAITPLVRRLIWLEPRVRRWWLLAIVILLMFFAYAGDRFYARQVESRLIHEGLAVQAKIVAADNHVGDQPIAPGTTVRLELTWSDRTEEDLTGSLTATSALGREITIHVDPSDHTRWTDRSEPTPLLDSLLIGALALPLIPVVMGIAFMQARGLIQVWQLGTAVVAVVAYRRQSPIAPMSYSLQCGLQSNRRRHLFTVYVPRSGYGLEKGDLIWVMVPPKKGNMLAAFWMAGTSV